jgi:hypothetical protein
LAAYVYCFYSQSRNAQPPYCLEKFAIDFDLSIIQSQADAKGQLQDLKAARLHAIFYLVLATFVGAQKRSALDNNSLTFGNHTKCANLKLFCFFLIGDMQGSNKITCTSASYGNTMNWMCSKCNIKGCDAGDQFKEAGAWSR